MHTTSSHWGMPSSNHGSFGKSFSHGTYFPGKNRHHWTYHCYWPKYGCECYWCPHTSCYYYWCEPSCCYYPVSYVQYAPPTQVQVQVSTPVTVAAPVPAPAPVLQTQTQTPDADPGGPAGRHPAAAAVT